MSPLSSSGPHRDYAEPISQITVTEALGCVFGLAVALACFVLALVACLQADAVRELQPMPAGWVPVCATEAECDALIRELERAPIDIWDGASA